MPALGLSARGIVVARGLGARKNIAGELLHSGALIPLASGILLLVLLWSLIVVQVADDLAMTKRDIIRKNDQLTRSLEEHVRSSLQAVDVELKLVAAEYRRAGLTPAVKFVMQIANENPLLLQCFILDESGRVAASTLPGAETRNYSDRSYFQVHRNQTADTLFVSEPLVGKLLGKSAIVVSRRISGVDGSFAGIAAFAVDPEYFVRFFQSMQLENGRLVRIVGTDGIVRANWNTRTDETGLDVRQGHLFQALRQSPHGAYQAQGIHYGVDRFFSYRALPDFSLIVQVGFETEAAFAEHRERRNLSLGMAVIGSLVVGFFTTAVILRERKRRKAETKLRLSEARYRTLMYQSHEAIMLVALETLEIVEANHAFERLTGYNFPQEKPLHLFDLLVDEPANVLRYVEQVRAIGSLPLTQRQIRTRDGGVRLVERIGSRLEIDGKAYQLTTLRDVTDEKRRELDLRKELLLAAQLQKALLPTIPRSGHFQIATVFHPLGFVSGDLYYLEWQNDQRVLRGVLLDLTGHGIATALQTAAVNVLLHQVMDWQGEQTLAERLGWLNRRIPDYIDETTFAAAIGFEIDFSLMELRYVSAGISHFLYNGEKVSVEGMYLGIRAEETYELHRRPIRQGDAVCFFSDGISDLLDREVLWETVRAEQICRMFRDGALTEKTQDDATAICVEVKAG